jgi:glucose-6-phosphate 1-epimerase
LADTRSPLVDTPLPSSVRLLTGDDQLPRLEVSARDAAARVFFHGAHLTAWHPSHVDAPVLWMSGRSFFQTDKPIRGGVPICFPWFGAHASAAGAPMHGFARLAGWTLSEAREAADGTVTLTFSLQDVSSAEWPHRFLVTYRIRVGAQLALELDVRNTGDDPFVFEEALHTYFAVENIEHVTVEGLENTAYLDKLAGFARLRQGGEPIRFSGETDRVYLDTIASSVIRDPGMRRRILISKSGSRSTVVWNPWSDKARAMPDFGDLEWRRMVCIETANIGSAAVRLEPGGLHTMTATIRVERD